MLPKLRKALMYYWKSKNRILTDRKHSLKKGGYWHYDYIKGYGWWVQTKKFGGKLTDGSGRVCPLRNRVLRQLRIKRRTR